jgi:hypothetical protein
MYHVFHYLISKLLLYLVQMQGFLAPFCSLYAFSDDEQYGSTGSISLPSDFLFSHLSLSGMSRVRLPQR